MVEYFSFGKGKKSLVLIQGLNTNDDIKGAKLGLMYMYRQFLKDYTIYVFSRPKEVYEGITIDDLANDLAKKMETLHLKDTYILAVSQGGMIAQSLAIHYPHLVKKMVLAVTLSKTNTLVENVIAHWIELCEKNKMKELVLDMTYKLYTPSYVSRYKPFLPLLTLLQKPKDINRFIILAKSCLSCTSHESLHIITCPVLIIGAKQDQIVGMEASYEMQEQLKCDLYMYEDYGHSVYEEASDFNFRVEQFFRQQ